MRAEARRPPRRWPWVAGLGVISGIVLVALLVGAPRETPSSTPTTSPSSTTSTSREVPSGCLVEGLDSAMLLRTQQLAPHTQEGAVELAAALSRWLQQYPQPSADDAAAAAGILASESPVNLQQTVTTTENPSKGLVPNGEPFHISTVLGEWLVESYSPERAIVSTQAAIVVNNAINPQFRLGTSFELVWEADHWAVLQARQPRDVQQLVDAGTAFEGGC